MLVQAAFPLPGRCSRSATRLRMLTCMSSRVGKLLLRFEREEAMSLAAGCIFYFAFEGVF